MQLIPARGRKQNIAIEVCIQTRLQLIPVRGRKPSIPIKPMSTRPDYNLSPQGDGNLLMCSRTRAEINYNSSPQGDGNPSDSILHTMNGSLQLIPARGQKSPSALVRTSAEGLCFSGFFCFRVSGRAFRRGWPRQREFPRCPAGRSASGGGSHSDRR